MDYNHPQRNGSTISIRLMCAIVFVCFSFVYLYFFQADVMKAAQHVLSHGQTHYNSLVGAFLITFVLQLIQVIAFSVFRLKKWGHALTYFPSMLLLAMLTSMNSDMDLHFSLGVWWWVLPLVLLAWGGCMYILRAAQDAEPQVTSIGIFSRVIWVNMLQMAILIIMVIAVGNTDAVFHYRMRAESKLMAGDYQGALEPGKKSLESDANLQMIRMYALSRTGELGERLFNYPISGNSLIMLPSEGGSRFTMYEVDSLYRYLGGRPAKGMTTARYLELLQHRDTLGSKRIADYQLCGLLIDKKLDEFVSRLKQLYADNDSLNTDQLPKHYREALILYTHQRSTPQMVYHHAVMEEDWNNLQELEAQYADKTERKGKVEEQYRGTYWYYFEYE